MSRFLRRVDKIDIWDNPMPVNREDALFTGDMLADLRTKDNKLSVWQADTEEDFEDAIVAMALCRDSVQKMCCLILDDQDLSNLEIEIIKDNTIDSNGIDESVLLKHGDLVNIDYWRIGYLTEYMLKIVQDKNRQKTYTKPEVHKLLNKYKQNNMISIDNMKSALKNNLKW